MFVGLNTSFLAALILLKNMSGVQGIVYPERQSNPGSGAVSSAEQAKQNSKDELAEIRLQLISRLQRYVDRALAFEELESRTRACIRLADTLWEVDESLARGLFLKTYDSLKARQPAIVEDRESPESQALSKSLGRLSSSLISHLARHEARLAKQLKVIGGDGEGDKFLKIGEFNSALRSLMLENDTTEAVKIGEGALKGDIGKDAHMLLLFLHQLRVKDQVTSDRLFSVALERLRAQPAVDPTTLMLLGSYLFTDPRLTGSEQEATTVRYVKVGNVSVVNLHADRPGISESLVRAYLETAVGILSRPVRDPQQKPYYYALAYQLWPKVERLSPELPGSLRLSLSYLTPDVAPVLTKRT